MKKSDISKITIELAILYLITGFMLIHPLSVHALETVKSIEQITSAVRNPQMRERWEMAYKKGSLPPLSTLPVPAQAVSQRQPVKQLKTAPIIASRPSVSTALPFDLQVFTEDLSITEYKGEFKVISHENGVLKGMISTSKKLFEVIYQLPEKRSMKFSRETGLFMDYKNRLSQASIQQRVVLYDKKSGTPKMLSISEGSDRPYKVKLSDIGLSIEQQPFSEKYENPPVTVSAGGKSVTLLQGENKVININNKKFNVYLLNSYAHNEKNALSEGQTYYVSLKIYE